MDLYIAQTPKPNWRWYAASWPTDRWLGVVDSASSLATLYTLRPWLQGRLPLAEQTDWSQNVLVVAALGTAPSGGYAVEIRRVRVQQEQVHVLLALKSPSPTELVIQIMTYPVAVQCIRKARLPQGGVGERWFFSAINARRLPTVPADQLESH